jgi:hypothetical protein
MTRTPDEPPAPTAPHGFLAELRDAVSLRAALLVIGVLALQVAFVVSYIGAFHHPKPHAIPLAVTAPDQRTAELTARRLAGLPGDPLDPRTASGEAAARRMVETRETDGALLVAPGGGPDTLLVAGPPGPRWRTAWPGW